MNSNIFKRISRRIRKGSQHKRVALCHILINVRSHESYGSVTFVNKDLIDECKKRVLHREFGIRNRIIDIYQERCFNPSFRKSHLGHKTYKHEGKFYPYDPLEEFPF